jgi:FKBP-type peptidyl-prolyl cis-trans isomerase FkpA
MQHKYRAECLKNIFYLSKTHMKTFGSLLFLLVILGNLSCLKGEVNSCTPKTVQSEQAVMLAYASANGINATVHSSGLYYEITNPGSGPTPSGTSKVYVKYTGKLTDGTVFDSQTNASLTGWVLNGLITGWQIGLPLIQKGGTIKLIIPSSLAYGCQTVGSIPANSVLYFEIELVDVQ